jgi:hypothetical protein
VPLIDGTAERVKQHAFAENGFFAAVQVARWKLVVPHAALEHARDAEGEPVLGGFEPAPGEAPRLFDLVADPDERANLFAGESPEVRRLFAVLREHDARMPIALNAVVRSRRDRDRSQLMDELGYAGGVGAERDTGAGRMEAEDGR